MADDFTTATSRIAWLALQIESFDSQYKALGQRLSVGYYECLGAEHGTTKPGTAYVDTPECEQRIGFIKTIWVPLFDKWIKFRQEYEGAAGKAKLALRTSIVAEDLNKFEVLLVSTALIARMKGFDVSDPEPRVYGPPADAAPEPKGTPRPPWVKPVVVGVAVAAGLGFLVMASRQS